MYKGDHEKMRLAVNNIAVVLQSLQKELARPAEASNAGQLTDVASTINSASRLRPGRPRGSESHLLAAQSLRATAPQGRWSGGGYAVDGGLESSSARWQATRLSPKRRKTGSSCAQRSMA